MVSAQPDFELVILEFNDCRPPQQLVVKRYTFASRCSCQDCKTSQGVWHLQLGGHADIEVALTLCNVCYNNRQLGHLSRKQICECRTGTCDVGTANSKPSADQTQIQIPVDDSKHVTSNDHSADPSRTSPEKMGQEKAAAD